MTTERAKLDYSGHLGVAFANMLRILCVLKPAERADLIDWVLTCYCPVCGYPAPPNGDMCSCCEEVDP
jgi:hypothetical protein